MGRTMGNNSHGNINEKNIVNALNNKKIKELNNNLKNFIEEVCTRKGIQTSGDTLIKSTYETSTKLKQDIYVEIEGVKVGVSCKMGTGNSVHQEKCGDFIDYIKETFNASDVVCNAIRLFIWADGTLDGSGMIKYDKEGEIVCRFKRGEFKKLYPKQREVILRFFRENERKLLRRFIFEGRHNSIVDFVYHGTEVDGVWLSAEEILDFQIKNSALRCENNISALPIGRLTTQPWNVSRNGNNEHKRGQIQAKYGSAKKDFSLLMKQKAKNIGTFFGDKAEFDISRQFNRNKISSKWNCLQIAENDLDDLYMVKVSSNQPSILSGKKVKTKSDAYLIKSDISETVMLQKEYVLDEDDLKDINYEYVDGSGISVKINDSTKYTIQKFTKASFYKAFTNYLHNMDFIFYSLLVYSDDKQIYKNKKMAQDLDIDLEKFIRFSKLKTGLTNINISKSHDLNIIRSKAQETIIDVIKNNDDLRDAIFKGKGWFSEPYVANYIYEQEGLKENTATDFTITTGSGRSKGKYTVIFKPKL